MIQIREFRRLGTGRLGWIICGTPRWHHAKVRVFTRYRATAEAIAEVYRQEQVTSRGFIQVDELLRSERNDTANH